MWLPLPHGDERLVDCVLEMLKNVIHSKVTLTELILEVNFKHFFDLGRNTKLKLLLRLQALKIESGFIGLIVISLFISVIPLCTTIVWICSSENNHHGRDERPSSDGEAVINFEETIDKTLRYRRTLQFFLQIFNVLLM